MIKRLLTLTLLLFTAFILASCAPGQCVDDGVCSLNEQVTGSCYDCKPDLTADIRSAFYDQDRNSIGATFCVGNYGGPASGNIEVAIWYTSENGAELDRLTKNIQFTSTRTDGSADLLFNEEGLTFDSDFWVQSQGYESSCFFHQFYGVQQAPQYSLYMDVDSRNVISEKDDLNNEVWTQVQGVRSPFEGYLIEDTDGALEVAQKFLYTSTVNEVPVTTYAIAYRTENGEQISATVAENENNNVEVFRQTYAHQIEKSERLDGPAEIYKYEQSGSFPYVQYLWFSEDGRAVIVYSRVDDVTTQTVLREYQDLHQPIFDIDQYIVENIPGWTLDYTDAGYEGITIYGEPQAYPVVSASYEPVGSTNYEEMNYIIVFAEDRNNLDELLQWYLDEISEELDATPTVTTAWGYPVYAIDGNSATVFVWTYQNMLHITLSEGSVDVSQGSITQTYLEKYPSDLDTSYLNEITVTHSKGWDYTYNNEEYEVSIYQFTSEGDVLLHISGDVFEIEEGDVLEGSEASFSIVDIYKGPEQTGSVTFTFDGKTDVNETYFADLGEVVVYRHDNFDNSIEIVGANSDTNHIVVDVNGQRAKFQEGEEKVVGGIKIFADFFYIANIPTLKASAMLAAKPNDVPPAPMPVGDAYFLKLNSPQTYQYNNNVYELEVVGGNSDGANGEGTVVLSVNGEREVVQEGETETYGSIEVFVKDIFVTNIPILDAAATVYVTPN